MPAHSKEELEGLQVQIDRVVYHYDEASTEHHSPHVFIYFISIKNLSDRKVTLLARKWVIRDIYGDVDIVEGDKIVGKTPILAPGEVFTYNSYHRAQHSSHASGSFHGIDQAGNHIFTRIPNFAMELPEDEA